MLERLRWKGYRFYKVESTNQKKKKDLPKTQNKIKIKAEFHNTAALPSGVRTAESPAARHLRSASDRVRWYTATHKFAGQAVAGL